MPRWLRAEDSNWVAWAASMSDVVRLSEVAGVPSRRVDSGVWFGRFGVSRDLEV